jgi:hypothetical protein
MARTLQPGEAPPLTAAADAALLLKKQGACREQPSGGSDAPAPSLSRKQRKLRERVQHAKSLRALSAAAGDNTSAAGTSQQCTEQESAAADSVAAADSASSLSPPASPVAAFEVVGFARQSSSCASFSQPPPGSRQFSHTAHPKRRCQNRNRNHD